MNLRISTKLWLPTLAMLGMLVVMATGVSMRTRDQIELSNQLQAREQEALHDASTWAGLTAANAARAVSLLLASDTEVEKALKPEIDATSARISALQKHIEELAQTAVDKAALAKVAESRKAYIDIRNAAMKLKAAGDVDGARALMASRMRPAVAAYLAHQEAFVELQRKQAAEAREASGRARMATVWGVVGLMSALIALNRPDQLRSHLTLAIQNGLTRDELAEAITHLAFYAGWPSAVSAVAAAKEVLPAR